MSAGAYLRLRPEEVAAGDGVTLATITAGDPAAPAVLLGHGVGSSSRFVLDALGVPLVEAGWRVVAYDLRGHGRSTPVADPDGHALARYAADVAALVERFAPAVVGGVSLGGHAAVACAAQRGGVRAALACLPAWTGSAMPGLGPHAAVAEGVRAVGIDGLVEAFRRDAGLPAWLRELLLRDWPSHDPASLAAALLALDGGDAPSADALQRLDVPLAVVGWPDDPGHPLAVARSWAGLAPRGALVEGSLGDMAQDLTSLGRVALRALADLGITP